MIQFKTLVKKVKKGDWLPFKKPLDDNDVINPSEITKDDATWLKEIFEDSSSEEDLSSEQVLFKEAPIVWLRSWLWPHTSSSDNDASGLSFTEEDLIEAKELDMDILNDLCKENLSKPSVSKNK